MPRLLLQRQLQCCLRPGTPKACSSSARSLSWRSICSGATASGRPRRDAGDGLRRGRTRLCVLARRALRRFGERGLATLGGLALVSAMADLRSPRHQRSRLCALLAWASASTCCDGADARHACRAGRARLGGRALRDVLLLGQASGVWLGAQIVDAAGLAPVFVAAAVGLAALTTLSAPTCRAGRSPTRRRRRRQSGARSAP